MDSQLKINTLFSNNMILQCERNVPIWGTGPDGKEVTVKFNGQTKKATITNQKWEVTLDPMNIVSAGISMYITCDDMQIQLDNILVGEVWFASGQSNMHFIVDYLQEPTKSNILNDIDYPNIRVFTQKDCLSDCAQTETTNGKWCIATPNNARNFATVATLFARGIHKQLNVPVGIVTAAYGGVRIEIFINDKILKESNLPVVEIPKENAYNAMISPLKPFSFRGMIWYQGEANCAYEKYREYYHQYMKLMVDQIRTEFRNPQMPVLQVQLPTYGLQDANYTKIRFEQMKAETVIDNIFTAITYDTGDPNEIHPSDKLPIGARLVEIALKNVYKMEKEDVYIGFPTYEKAEINGNAVIVTFKDANEGLEIKDTIVNGLEVCGKNGVYYQAKAQVINCNQIKVTCDMVDQPVGIRYACKSNMYPAQFFGKNAYPVKPFKEDRI